MKTSALAHLKVVELSRLAILTGLNVGGTKAELTTRLQHGLVTPRLPITSPCRILSIDMGIRNLAYSVLDIQQLPTEFTAESSPLALDYASLQAWEREEVAGGSTAALDKFEPRDMAPLAYNTMSTLLERHQPTHILIERQRHRSGGGPAVLEWTVRVNLLEGMFHAVLECMSRTRHAAGGHVAPVVESVLPSKVGGFWLARHPPPSPFASGSTREKAQSAGSRTAEPRTRPRSSRVEKEAKIGIAEEWLTQRSTSAAARLACASESAIATRSKFLYCRTKQPDEFFRDEWKQGRKAVLPKLDDLADSLLQGMAWVQWEINRRLISMSLRDGLQRDNMEDVVRVEVPTRGKKQNKKVLDVG